MKISSQKSADVRTLREFDHDILRPALEDGDTYLLRDIAKLAKNATGGSTYVDGMHRRGALAERSADRFEKAFKEGHPIQVGLHTLRSIDNLRHTSVVDGSAPWIAQTLQKDPFFASKLSDADATELANQIMANKDQRVVLIIQSYLRAHPSAV
jgi:hypothetical protein